MSDEKLYTKKDVHLAWLAGLWEGDGAIGITKVTDGYQCRMALSQSMKETELIDYISSVLSENNIHHSVYDFVNRKYPQRAVYIQRKNDVRLTLEKITPHLKGRKRKRANLILGVIGGILDPETTRLELKELSIRSYDGVRGGRKATKIPVKDYPAIKQRYVNGEFLKDIAKDYDVTKQAIWYVINKK